jgi:hypothetical protein
MDTNLINLYPVKCCAGSIDFEILDFTETIIPSCQTEMTLTNKYIGHANKKSRSFYKSNNSINKTVILIRSKGHLARSSLLHKSAQ